MNDNLESGVNDRNSKLFESSSNRTENAAAS